MMHRQQQRPRTSSSIVLSFSTTTSYQPSCATLSSSSSSSLSSSSIRRWSKSSTGSTSSWSTTSTTSYPNPVLSIFGWSVTILLIFTCLSTADARGVLLGHSLGKRSFFDIQCKGVYDKSLYARLDRICEDCYNLFREPALHSLCRKDCFTTDYFKGCIDVLLLQDELSQIQKWIKQLHGAPPDIY